MRHYLLESDVIQRLGLARKPHIFLKLLDHYRIPPSASLAGEPHQIIWTENEFALFQQLLKEMRAKKTAYRRKPKSATT